MSQATIRDRLKRFVRKNEKLNAKLSVESEPVNLEATKSLEISMPTKRKLQRPDSIEKISKIFFFECYT